MNLLNLGCGSNFHKDWVNIDFVSNSEWVKSHNLLDGIPFDANSMDVVYHSHVLEHFSKSDGTQFIKECYRVLKTNGIIRIAVPDLETIAKEYLKHLQLAILGEKEAKYNYDWIILELFDQMVRNESGGAIKSYLHQPVIPNEAYVFNRIGLEGKKIRMSFLNQQHTKGKFNKEKVRYIKRIRKYFKRIFYKLRHIKNKNNFTKSQKKALKIGQFREGGEIHQWMYDRYSLATLLDKVGFSDIKICSPFESTIENWDLYQLDVVNGEVRKPDSLFIEARKL
jgi:predicted SAM-dependent methyltransferase